MEDTLESNSRKKLWNGEGALSVFPRVQPVRSRNILAMNN